MNGATQLLAGVVLPDSEGRILLLHGTNPSQWELPGGKVEPGEHPKDAAKREAKEELGVDVDDLELVADVTFYDQGQDWRYLWFWPRIIDGTPYVILEHDRFDNMRSWWRYELMSMSDKLSPNVRAFLVDSELSSS